MSTSSALHYPSVLELFYFAFILPIIIAKPFPSNETLYDASVRSLLNNKCKMPKEIKFPFSESSDPNTFDYLKVPLKACQTTESLMEKKESNLLCKEIFEVLENITCTKYYTSLPEIKSLDETDDVCSKFKAMENIIPKQNKYLSGRLEDALVCNILCQDKFEILCQILLWSYNVQYQLKNPMLTTVAEDENVKTMTSKVLDTQNIPQEPVLDINNNPSKGEQHIAVNQAVNGTAHEQPKNVNDLNIHLDSESSSENLGGNDKNSKIISSTPNGNVQETKGVASDVQVASDQQKSLQDIVPNKNVESTNVESNQVMAEKNKSVSNDHPHKAINANKISKNLTAQITTPGIHDKKVSSSTLQDQNKSKTNTLSNNVKTNSNLETPTTSITVEENEFNNGLEEENESKVPGKSSDSEIPLANNTNKLTGVSKETNSAFSSKIASDIELSTLQISSELNANVEQNEEQDEKDEQYYNDTENEGDYSKSEYESSLNKISKAKKPEIKSSGVSEVTKPNEMSVNNDVFINRNNFGRGHDEMPFSGQEDGHFFFYFLSIVLILMAGYLIFHNKQKIIALIVEGRHERRRRSHGAGYKKLETK